MLRAVLLLGVLLMAGCARPAPLDDGSDGAPDEPAAPPAERLGLADVLPLLDGDVTYLSARLQNGTSGHWWAGGVRNGSVVQWDVHGAGTSVSHLPLPPTEYPNRTVVERVDGPAAVEAVPADEIPAVPADARNATVWWDVRHGWSTGGDAGWDASWRDWSSDEVVAQAPGVVVGLRANEGAGGVVRGALVPPDPSCGDGRAVQWTVLVREDGGRRAYTFTGGEMVRGDWQEAPEEELEAVDWHDSGGLEWLQDCISYRAGFVPEYVGGEQVYQPRWELSRLWGDTALTASFDGRTGEPA